MDRRRCEILGAAVLMLFLAPAGASAGERKYAPDRKVDILHVVIDVTPDFKARTVAGTTTLRFVPIARPLAELRLDAVDLAITAVESTAAVDGYDATDEHLIVTFVEPVPVGAEAAVTITHRAEPQRGLYFRTPDMGYRPEDIHLWTQGETHLAPHWYPCFDYPNERFTSEIVCRVPEDMVVLSNGTRVSEFKDPATKLKAVRWRQDKPHVNYLVALVAGRLKAIHGHYRDVPLGFYTPTSQIDQARNSFRDTDDMMGFFERDLGVRYPWAQYNQVVVDDFTHGGMENTTLTVLTDRTLFTDASENIRSSQNLVAHELVHQWFGNYVTCKDWSHLWLNEGFATYYAHLYDGHKNGRDAMCYGLYRDAQRILGAKDAPRPIVYRLYRKASDQFDYRAYKKGSWLLHMLRTHLGEDLYRRCITTYLERHALQSVVTEDLNAVIEEVTGRSFDRFFDQWVYHARYPELEVSYRWSQADKLAKLTVRQTQDVTDKVLLFAFATKVRLKTKSAVVDREIEVDQKQHDFFFSLPEAPTVVRFDPQYGLLAKVKFDKPKEMLYAQLADTDDAVGRLLAIEALKSKKDKDTIAKLKAALNGDPFYGVRLEASKALREIHTAEAFEALADSVNQPDARVRQQVVDDVGGFYRDEGLAKMKDVLKNEKNPEILATAIAGLGRYHDPDIRDTVLTYLGSSSYRNRLADAAIGAIRSLDDATYGRPLMKVLREAESAFTSRGFGAGLDALAYICRDDDKTDVRTFLTGYVNHKKRQIQIAAIEALGTLRDPSAISVVETFQGPRDDDPVQRAAKNALKKLRDVKKVPVELGDLRKEVLELKKANETLQEDVEAIKKKLEAKEKGSDQKEPVPTRTTSSQAS